MNEIAKDTQATKDFDQLKIRLKTTWMMGDYDLFSRYLEKDFEYSERAKDQRRSQNRRLRESSR